MSNADKYHFSDFTFDNYKKLLLLAKENYVFKTYTDLNKNERFIIWRHDVDYSMHMAYELAKIEAKSHVRSIYYLHLHSEFYNLLEAEISALVRKIIGLGHSIGIHFDIHYYNANTEVEIERYLTFEKTILENFFKSPVTSFSFHNTNDFIMGCRKWQYAGLINAYAEYFQKEVGYCSDSNGYWRYERLEDVLTRATQQRLQILTHPEWWRHKVMSPKERIWNCIEGRAAACKKNYSELLASFGLEYIDW